MFSVSVKKNIVTFGCDTFASCTDIQFCCQKIFASFRSCLLSPSFSVSLFPKGSPTFFHSIMSQSDNTSAQHPVGQDSSPGTGDVFFDQFVTPTKTISPSCPTEKSLPSRGQIGAALLDEKAALCLLESKGVIEVVRNCPHCSGVLLPMSKKLLSKSRFVLRCRKRRCEGFARSVLHGSILMQCRYEKNKFVHLSYQWLLGNKSSSIARSLGMSPNTVTDWTNYFRKAVSADLLFNDECQIGGPGIIVEIDESKFGKRKYHVSAVCITFMF